MVLLTISLKHRTKASPLSIALISTLLLGQKNLQCSDWANVRLVKCISNRYFRALFRSVWAAFIFFFWTLSLEATLDTVRWIVSERPNAAWLIRPIPLHQSDRSTIICTPTNSRSVRRLNFSAQSLKIWKLNFRKDLKVLKSLSDH